MMHFGFPTRTRKHLDFQRHRVEKIPNSLGAFFNIVAFHQLRIVDRDSYRTTTGVTVMTSMRRSPNGVVILHVDGLVVAIQCNQRGGPDLTGVGTERHFLGSIDSISNPASKN
jgi:hypothetical protein